MQREPVDSTSIAALGYDPGRRELEVEFRQSGEIYRYFDVPNEDYDGFKAAKSKGRYLNQVFKRRGYRYTIVQPRDP